jgi:hypothetical protein
MRHKRIPILEFSNHKKDTKAAPYHNVLTNSWNMSAPLVAAHHLHIEFGSFCSYCLLHGFSPTAISKYHWQRNFSSDQELMPWQTTFFHLATIGHVLARLLLLLQLLLPLLQFPSQHLLLL